MKKESINKFFRGQRNNNPMNIVGGPNRWQGMKGKQEDRNFVQFTTMTYGVRAAMILLTKYHRDYNLKTVPEIIHRWAPDGGEAEKNYITHVRNIYSREYRAFTSLSSIPARSATKLRRQSRQQKLQKRQRRARKTIRKSLIQSQLIPGSPSMMPQA